MIDSTRFEDRLTVALGRYADRVPVDVDADHLVGLLASKAMTSRTPRRGTGGRRLALIGVAVAVVTLTGLALFGGRLMTPTPPAVVSLSPSGPTVSSTPEPTASPTPEPTASPSATPVAVLDWTARDIGSQPAVTSIWRVGKWFVAVGPESSFGDDDDQVDARFIRSRDGRSWESVPAPARGMEVETGSVDSGVLWVVGRLGSSADPKRGIWTTRDGATWQRIANVDGLDFGPGRVDEISPARNGWLALARRWVNAEAQEGLMLTSADGARWTTAPYPAVQGLSGIVGLVSDGDRWLLAIQTGTDPTDSSLQALTSEDGLEWTSRLVATLEQGGPDRNTSSGDDVGWGEQGFVITGTRHEGEFPHPLAWHSSDAQTWTSAQIEALPGIAGESGIQLVAPFEDGYLATGHRLQEAASFWTSGDGKVWTQVDDLFGGPLSRVHALAVSGDTFVASGEEDNGPFIWSAPRP